MAFTLSKKSIEILNNLSSINENMVIVEGCMQSATKQVKHLYATATLPDSIDSKFSLYNINDLLGKVRLFDEDFTITYDDLNKTLEMKDYYSSVIIRTSNDNNIVEPKIGSTIGEDATDIAFTLSSANLAKIVEFNKVTGTTVISFAKRDGDDFIRVEGFNEDKLTECMQKGQDLKPVWFIRLEEASDLESFSYFTELSFKILDDDYDVRIRQFHGVRGTQEHAKINSKRVPAIQLDGEYIRYVFLYKHYSNNQISTQNME